MCYEIVYFHPRIQKDIERWPDSIKADYAHLADLLEEFGPDLKMPFSKALGKGLFEIRPKGKDGIGRALYCFVKGKRIIILHAFIKKTQAIPKKN